MPWSHPPCSNPQWGWHPLCRPEEPLLGVRTAVQVVHCSQDQPGLGLQPMPRSWCEAAAEAKSTLFSFILRRRGPQQPWPYPSF